MAVPHQLNKKAPYGGEFYLGVPQQSRELAVEEAYWEGLMQQLQLAIEQGEAKRIAQAKEELAKALEKTVKVGKGSNSFTEIRRLRGKKVTYVRSDKMKNHWRSYSLRVDDRDRSLFEEKKLNGKTYRILNKKALQNQFARKVGGAIAEKDWDGNLLQAMNRGWADYLDEINRSLSGAAQQPGVAQEQVQWQTGWDAQLLRYYAGGKAQWNTDLAHGKVNIGAQAEASINLAQARALFQAYWPYQGGHALLIDMPLKQGGTQRVNLGALRGRLTLEGTGLVGASAMGSLSLSVELDQARDLIKFKGADKAKDRKQTHPPVGASASGRLFAGAEAGGKVKGDIEWRNPEAQFDWKSFLGMGTGLSGAAGVGVEGDFFIRFDDGKFRFKGKAGIVLGSAPAAK